MIGVGLVMGMVLPWVAASPMDTVAVVFPPNWSSAQAGQAVVAAGLPLVDFTHDSVVVTRVGDDGPGDVARLKAQGALWVAPTDGFWACGAEVSSPVKPRIG